MGKREKIKNQEILLIIFLLLFILILATEAIAGDVTFRAGDLNVTGNVSASYYFGDGSELINIPATGNTTAEIGAVCTLYPTGNTTAELTEFLNTNRTKNIAFQNNISIGTSDTTTGVCSLYGDDAAAGAILRLFNSANEDDIWDYWDIYADGTNLRFKGEGSADALIISSTDVTSGLNLVEGTRAQFFTYKTSTQDMPVISTWYNLSWSDVTAPVNYGFTHSKTGAVNDSITIDNSGTYLIAWTIHIYDANAQTSSTRILDDGAEIAGSLHVMTTNAAWPGEIHGSIIAKTIVDSILKVQVGTDHAGTDISSFDTAALPDGILTSATISITKLSNDI